MLKKEWGAENNVKLPHLFTHSKTATLVPVFAVEDLPLGRSAALVPEFAVKTCLWAEHSDDMFICPRRRLHGMCAFKEKGKKIPCGMRGIP